MYSIEASNDSAHTCYILDHRKRSSNLDYLSAVKKSALISCSLLGGIPTEQHDF